MGKFVKLQAFRWLEENCHDAFLEMSCVVKEIHVRTVNVASVERNLMFFHDYFSEEEIERIGKNMETIIFRAPDYIEGYLVRLINGAEYFAPKKLNDMSWLEEK